MLPILDQWNLFLSAFSSFSKKTSIWFVILWSISLHQKHAKILISPKDKEARAVVLGIKYQPLSIAGAGVTSTRTGVPRHMTAEMPQEPRSESLL